MRDGTMSRQKRSVEKTIKTTLKMAFPSVGVLSLDAFIPGPRVRQQLGISAVTLWRWRQDNQINFPPGKRIKGRLYFSQADISNWLASREVA
jgi:predicted DNA-binding transcriptional regulator AlpA